MNTVVEECEICWGTGYYKGIGAPCSACLLVPPAQAVAKMGESVSKLGKQFEEWYARVRRDPLVFAREAMLCIDEDDKGEHNPKLTEQQVELLREVQRETLLPVDERKKRITVKSGQGTGKTTCEVILALWRAFWAVDALVVVTAPTAVQVRDVWIAEFRRVLHKAHPFVQKMVEVTNTKVTIGGRPTWGIWTRSAARPENFQGYHQKYLTFIVDEASGVDREIFRVIKGTLTNPNSLIVCAGNPNTRECAFFDMFYKPSEAKLWHKFTFNAEKTPITDKENIRRLKQEFGENSDVVRVRVYGEFPVADPNAVMSTDDLWACTGVPMLQAATMRGTLQVDKAIGIDLARFGSDESVIYRRSGLAVVETQTFAHCEPLDVIEAAFDMQARAGWRDKDCHYIVDAGGMGQGVMAVLYRAHKKVHEFHTKGRPSSSDYADKMTEAYFNVARLAKERRLHLPDDEHLISQLGGRLYGTDPKGKLLLEKKDEYMKRNEGMSPDRADALALCFYNGVMARGSVA